MYFLAVDKQITLYSRSSYSHQDELFVLGIVRFMVL